MVLRNVMNKYNDKNHKPSYNNADQSEKPMVLKAHQRYILQAPLCIRRKWMV